MKIADTDTIYLLQKQCLSADIPFVSYCLPKHRDIHTMIQYRSMPVKLSSMEQVNQRSGFVIAPFHADHNFPVYFLEPDIHLSGNEIDDSVFGEISRIAHKKRETSFNQEYFATGREEFMQQVRQITGTILEKEMDKVVLSRIQLVDNQGGISAPEVFYALCEKYPRAFKYVFNIPGAGCWLGATPEPLVEITENKVQTVSLAGTQYLNGTPADKVQWQTKELEEQKFVTDFIEDRLIKFGITDYEKQGPVNQPAANLVHLKSVFTFDSAVLQGRTGEFISVLHPTPSVCGLPRRKAYEFIKKLEHHNREYYTGFLGPVNISKCTHVYVNLRCMKMLDNQFALFMGAGITAGSDPASEWEETNQKMMTMLNVINSLNHK